MRISRYLALKINFILDQLVPPIIRDSKWFMFLPLRIALKDKAVIFLEFKEKATAMNEKEFGNVYEDIRSVIIDRETDLNDACINEIIENISGNNVLEVGCGKCFLAKKISEKYLVTATDIVIDPKLIDDLSDINFKKCNIENLPFNDKEFDTVVCTHTLEHVQNIYQALSELRRVTKKRLIIVVPKQRPYKYTLDLHLNFFPYRHSLLRITGNKNNFCTEIGGDLFYIEDR